MFCFGILVMVCQAPAPAVISDFCTTYQLVRPSHSDTAATRRQIVVNNAAYHKFCETQPRDG